MVTLFLQIDIQNGLIFVKDNAHNADVQENSFTRVLRCGCWFYTLLDPLL